MAALPVARPRRFWYNCGMKRTMLSAAVISAMCVFAEDDGFVSIFNGNDLSGWEGDTEHYYAEGGMLKCRQSGRFGGGNLWTAKSYQNFHLKFEFKIPPEANNGVAIRCPPAGRASQQGMEIQILDDTAPYYWEKLKLKPYQWHGSIYGVVPAKRKPGHTGLDTIAKTTYLKPVGEWNSEEIIADGHRIIVILNGETIVDADVSKFRGNGDTPDHLEHPGLNNLQGRIGWCGHGYNIEWRNIRVKELPPSPLEIAGARWAFDADGKAMWFANGVEPNAGGWSVLWGAGSPVPAEAVRGADGTFTITSEYSSKEHPDWYRRDTLRFRPTNAEYIECTYEAVRGSDGTPKKFSGLARRIPEPMRPPRLHYIDYEDPIDLLADGMDGWEPLEKTRPFCWKLEDGVLSNVCTKDENGKSKPGANIVTKRRDFKNFKLVYDVKVPKGCNSGVYLRGIYEIQTLDSQGKAPDCHNMGALYGRITPSMAAEKWADQWQHVEVILYNRYVTVTLNDQRIIDNKPVLGCTGGAITADEFVPGPIYLQGDHSDASYRRMMLFPIKGDLN